MLQKIAGLLRIGMERMIPLIIAAAFQLLLYLRYTIDPKLANKAFAKNAPHRFAVKNGWPSSPSLPYYVLIFVACLPLLGTPESRPLLPDHRLLFAAKFAYVMIFEATRDFQAGVINSNSQIQPADRRVHGE